MTALYDTRAAAVTTAATAADQQPYEYVRRELVEPDWRRYPGWRDVTDAQWRDAQWQRSHCVKNAKQLHAVVGRADVGMPATPVAASKENDWLASMFVRRMDTVMLSVGDTWPVGCRNSIFRAGVEAWAARGAAMQTAATASAWAALDRRWKAASMKSSRSECL